tara:strand:- start:6825 stop:7427 length:603 start_codon:yes stop_codon:yes gene_type:complete
MKVLIMTKGLNLNKKEMNLPNKLKIIKSVFEKQGHQYIDPYTTTHGSVFDGKCGNHKGLYYFYENNFYFGLAATGNIIERHEKHRPKLNVDYRKLYGPLNIKEQEAITFPKGWRDGVRKFIIEDKGIIPASFIRISKDKIKPGVMDYPIIHKVNVKNLKLLVWNLDHYTNEEIKNLEKEIIKKIEPYCNHETYKKRNSIK